MSDDMSQENESTIKEEEIQNEGKKKQFYSINLTTERVFLIFVLLIAIIAIVVVAFVFSTSSKTVSKNKDVASEEVIDEIVSNDDFAFFDDENTMELLDGEDAPAPVPEKVTITEGAENTETAAKQEKATEPEVVEEKVVDVEKKPEITYDDFAKLQFQIGEIIKCEEVKKSKKLLCSQVKIGSEVRQIVSGIKAWYKPEEMVGKKVMVVTNLKPAKLAGLMSEGMILCAGDDEDNLALMVPEKDMKPGSEVC